MANKKRLFFHLKKPRLEIRRDQSRGNTGCPNFPNNGVLYCDGSLYSEHTVPTNNFCTVQCFDNFEIEKPKVFCEESSIGRNTVPRWSSTIDCS